MIGRSSFCGPLGVLLVLILICTVSRTVILVLAFSSSAQVDSGCVCAGRCVGMCIYVCESLKFEGGTMSSWFRDSTFNIVTVRVLLCSETLGTSGVEVQVV